jgi:hypothetical protein
MNEKNETSSNLNIIEPDVNIWIVGDWYSEDDEKPFDGAFAAKTYYRMVWNKHSSNLPPNFGYFGHNHRYNYISNDKLCCSRDAIGMSFVMKLEMRDLMEFIGRHGSFRIFVDSYGYNHLEKE